MTSQLLELTTSVRVVQRAVHVKWMEIVRQESLSNSSRKKPSLSSANRTRTSSSISTQSLCSSVDPDPGSDSSDESIGATSPMREFHPSFLSRIKPKRPSSAGLGVPLRVRHVRGGSLGSEKLFRVNNVPSGTVVMAKSESIQSLVDPRLSSYPLLKNNNTSAGYNEVRRSSVTGQMEPVSALSRSSIWRASCSQLHLSSPLNKSMSSLPRSPSTLKRSLNSVSTAV